MFCKDCSNIDSLYFVSCLLKKDKLADDIAFSSELYKENPSLREFK